MTFQAIESMPTSLVETQDESFTVEQFDQIVAAKLGASPSEGDLDYVGIERDAFGYSGPFAEGEPFTRSDD